MNNIIATLRNDCGCRVRVRMWKIQERVYKKNPLIFFFTLTGAKNMNEAKKEYNSQMNIRVRDGERKSNEMLNVDVIKNDE